MKRQVNFYYVYLITNIILNKQYVGSRICYALTPEEDIYWGTSDYLDADIKIYGIENFTKEIISTEYTNKNDMLNGETFYILKYNTLEPNGYNRFLPNVRKGFHRAGQSTYNIWVEKYGVEIADQKLKECNAKISKTLKELYKIKENHPMFGRGYLIEGEKNGMYNKHHSEKAKKQIGITRKERGCGVGEKNNMFGNGYKITGENNGMFGKHHTDKSKEKLRNATLNTPKITCQECLKDYYPWHYIQYHGEKCKLYNHK